MDYHSEPNDRDLIFDFKEMFDNIKLSHVMNNYGWALTNVPNIVLDKDIQSLPIDFN